MFFLFESDDRETQSAMTAPIDQLSSLSTPRQEWRLLRFWPIRTRTTYSPYNFWLVERPYPAGWMSVVHLFYTVLHVGIGRNWGDCNRL